MHQKLQIISRGPKYHFFPHLSFVYLRGDSQGLNWLALRLVFTLIVTFCCDRPANVKVSPLTSHIENRHKNSESHISLNVFNGLNALKIFKWTENSMYCHRMVDIHNYDHKSPTR